MLITGFWVTESLDLDEESIAIWRLLAAVQAVVASALEVHQLIGTPARACKEKGKQTFQPFTVSLKHDIHNSCYTGISGTCAEKY